MSTQPDGPEFDLSTYRKHVLSTTTCEDPAIEAMTTSQDVVLSTFLEKVTPFEKKKWANALRWDIPATALSSLADNIMHEQKSTLDEIAAVPAGEHTFENTLMKYEVLDRKLAAPYASLDFVSDVSPIKEVRDVSNEAKEKLSAFFIQQASRKDIYEAVLAFSKKDQDVAALTPDYKKMLEDVLKDFKRMGMALPEDKRQELIAIKTKISALQIKGQQNVGEENTSFEFEKDDLVGLDDAQLKAFPYNEETKKYTVTLKTPSYLPVMKYCENPKTRAIMEKAYNSRCIENNTPIMEELLQHRTALAQLLGFESYTDYALDEMMIKTKSRVNQFLGDLNTKLTPLYEKDNEQLLKTKESTYSRLGLPTWEKDEGKTVIYPYDRAFLTNIVEKEEYAVDHNKLKEFFPTESVLTTMFESYQELFGVKFVDVTAENKQDLYHPDVKLFNVFDTHGKQDPEKLFAQIYLDLEPRVGKYGHAAVFPLIQSYKDERTGERHPPICAVVCNFPPATAEQPSLLPHGDVVTLFHEFGHAIHHVVTDVALSRDSGTSVKRDFVELPSQMLENLVSAHKPTLKKIMKHYKTGEFADDETIDKLIKSDKCQSAAFNKRQLVFGIADQRLHQITDPKAKTDTAAVYRQTMLDVMNADPTPDTNMISGFSHILGGYQGSYYGYLYSLSMSHAVWSEIEKNDVSVEIFRKYRDTIVSQGGSKDPNVLLYDFLGAPPTNDAFLKSLGLFIADEKRD